MAETPEPKTGDRVASFLRRLSGGAIWRPSWITGWLYLLCWTTALQIGRYRRGSGKVQSRGKPAGYGAPRSMWFPGKRRPRVLMVCPYPVYPPNHGGGVRIFNLARCITEHCELQLFIFIQGEDDPVQRHALEPVVERLYFHRWQPSFRPGFFGLRPRGEQLFASDEARQRIDEIVARERVDILQLEYTELGQYGLGHRAGVRVVLTEHDITFRSRWRRRAVKFHRRYPADRTLGWTLGDWMRQARYELMVTGRADQVHVMSESDADYLGSYLPGGRGSIRVIPNGVAVDHYHPVEGNYADPRRLLFVGNFQHLPNLDALEFFFKEIWGRIRAREPEVRLTVAGASPPEQVIRYGTIPGVSVAGSVPDLLPCYQGHSILVAPIRAGSGTRLKILEAMACGLPVVSTTIGAEGIDCLPGKHLLIADKPGAFAGAVQELMNSQDLRTRLAVEGRRLVKEKYDWNLSARALLAAYGEMM